MKKKIFCSFTSLILVVALTACGDTSATTVSSSAGTSTVEAQPTQHVHDWKDATCTEPKTCSGCGETEGEALGHDWADATCTEPKTCTRCGETEGEALGHDWAEATLTEPKTCTKCGATEGEPLSTADIAATVIEDEKYFEDGAFCPKLYAEELGFKWYGDYDDEVDLAIVVDDVTYFVWFTSSSTSTCNVVYTDGEKCYGTTVLDIPEDHRDTKTAIKIADVTVDSSTLFAKAMADILCRLANGETSIKDWEFKGLTYGYGQHNCQAQYFDDGYIDSTKLVEKDASNSFVVYYDD